MNPGILIGLGVVIVVGSGVLFTVHQAMQALVLRPPPPSDGFSVHPEPLARPHSMFLRH